MRNQYLTEPPIKGLKPTDFLQLLLPGHKFRLKLVWSGAEAVFNNLTYVDFQAWNGTENAFI